MPLTHVVMWDPNRGYVRVTPEEASEMFPYESVSANRGFFTCELCGQHVSFVYTKRHGAARHFKHSRGEQDKTCSERQQAYDRQLLSMSNHSMPLRIKVFGDYFSFSIGFFLPPSGDSVSPECTRIFIRGSEKKDYVYSFGRIQKGAVTFLDVGESPSVQYTIRYESANQQLTHFWPQSTPGVNPEGTFFDSGARREGTMLSAGSKVYAQKKYYLLIRGAVNRSADIELREVVRHGTSSNGFWRLYEVTAKKFSRQAADFFLRYSLFLSERPAVFFPIWPASVQSTFFIYHEKAVLYWYQQGFETELQTFPILQDFRAPKYERCETGELVYSVLPNKEQMLARGSSGTLGFTYLMRRNLDMVADLPSVTISDLTGSPVEEECCTKLPKGCAVIITAPYDGRVLCRKNGRTYKAYRLVPEEPLTVEPIQFGQTIHIYQGCDEIRVLRFEKGPDHDTQSVQDSDNDLVMKLSACRGEAMAIPHSFGSIANQLRDYPKTLAWLREEIRNKQIDRSAYRLLIKVCGEFGGNADG